MLAAIAGDKTVVQALLRVGADHDLQDVDGRTASWWATQNKYDDIVALLEHGR